MKLYKTKQGIILEKENNYFKIEKLSWDELLNISNLYSFLESYLSNPVYNFDTFEIVAPIVSQEIWASGVTYLRSKTARMEESKNAGGGDFYDKVYDAKRPEIFFKATAARTSGHLQEIRIRKDSKWNVPEPELTLVINNQNKIIGYTVGNDVSSRDIEGENPLYLPQAKSYDKSAAIGPCILVIEEKIDLNSEIELKIERNSELIFQQKTAISQIKRTFEELVDYLTMECSFPQGVFLMTGTGIIPPDEFSLISGDIVHITIDNIGTLTNKVA